MLSLLMWLVVCCFVLDFVGDIDLARFYVDVSVRVAVGIFVVVVATVSVVV